ncbi:MAG: hypothetical protein DRJ97_06515 [Thermoprotei archaeon]|nr:MAG: hypothetical protein DRJ97_06515 [Thermoprotei archaeon]
MASTPSLRWRLTLIVAVCLAVIAAAIGYLCYTGLPRPIKVDVVAVISVDGPILSSQDAEGYIKAINEALTNSSIKAVVVKITSPGGAANLIEQVYLDLLELSEAKPVIALADIALSGGYYIAVASSHIYAEPTSLVGGVGVVGIMPPTLIPSERYLESGVYKITGFPELSFPSTLTRALENFISAVRRGRADRLKITSLELKEARIYIGSEALELGLVDELGSLQSAIKRAAEEAGLTRYKVVGLNPSAHPLLNSKSSPKEAWWRSLTVELLSEYQPPPSLWYIYLPPSLESRRTEVGPAMFEPSQLGESGDFTVVVDKSHENRVSLWELDLLVAELVKRNATVVFASTWDEVKGKLKEASALIIASPTKPYSLEESSDVESFVHDGGVLLLLFDPAFEYVNLKELTGPINTVASCFGLYFAKGYLYNNREHYGFYRNIYVSSLANTTLTRDLSSLVFFTATYIHSSGKGVAWTSKDTCTSIANRASAYPVIALVEDGKGLVVALGDQTFLKEPYCYVEDNYKLLLNLASLMLKSKS